MGVSQTQKQTYSTVISQIQSCVWEKDGGGRGGSYMSKFDRKVDVVVFLAGDLVAALLKGGHVGRAGWHASGQAGRERGVP